MLINVMLIKKHVSTFGISMYACNLTYKCFVYWCMHLSPNNLVHAIVFDTT